jgi:ABC-2 type transport system ATP-binding protein
MSLIEIKNLTKKFGTLKALDKVSLNVGKGEIFGLLGPNGSGKTTLIKCITGQIKPSEGNMSVLGIDVLKDPIKARELIGIIPEQENPPSFLTAEEYLYFVAKLRKLKNIDSEINYWFKFLEFEDQRNALCKDLSRGTRQKLMISQAFLHKPVLVFIDEPLINLDPIIQRKIKDFLIKYAKKGNTVFICTHILEIAQEICSNISILNKGKLLYHGKPKKDLEGFFLRLIKDVER